MEERGEVKALVAPVGQVAAGGAVAGALAVDIEDEAVVGADADDISWPERRRKVSVRRKWRTMGSRSGAVGWVIQEACQSRWGGSGGEVGLGRADEI